MDAWNSEIWRFGAAVPVRRHETECQYGIAREQVTPLVPTRRKQTCHIRCSYLSDAPEAIILFGRGMTDASGNSLSLTASMQATVLQ